VLGRDDAHAFHPTPDSERQIVRATVVVHRTSSGVVMGLGSTGLGSRRAGPLVSAVPIAALIAGLIAVLTGCGHSVADADTPIPTAPATATLSPFCAAAQDNANALRPLNGFAQRGVVPPDQLQPTVDAVRHSGIELLAAAPSEIRPDVQTVVDALDAQLDALVRANGDISAVERGQAASSTAASSDAVAASQRVSAYITRTCS